MLNVTIVGDRELVAKFSAIPSKLHDQIYRATVRLALMLEAKVKKKLSGEVLNVVTGALRRSIQNKVTDSPTFVRGQVYSAGDVKYAGIHEFGGKTKPHIIEPKNAKALAFMKSGKQVFAARVNHPGSKMPERSYMRSSLKEMAEQIQATYRDAIKQGLNK